MSNSYLQFSMSIPLRNAAEKAWCTETLKALVDLLDEAGDKKKLLRTLGDLGRRAVHEDWGFAGFEWSIEQASPDEKHFADLLLYCEESGHPEQVAGFLEAYLAKFNPAGVLTFAWAFISDSMSVNEFGGGAAVVTATGSKFIDAQDWAEENAEKLTASSQSA